MRSLHVQIYSLELLKWFKVGNYSVDRFTQRKGVRQVLTLAHKPPKASKTSDSAFLPIAAVLVLNALLLSVSGAALGQSSADFTLFEPVGAASSSTGSSPNRRNSTRQPNGSVSEAEFSLVGTSRIGTKASVTLMHQSGKTLRVPIERQRMAIPGYEQYVVIGFDRDRVSIQYPPSTSCADFAADGFSCDATRNVALLSLTVDDPSLTTAEQTKTQPQGPGSGQQEGGDVPINPFEALRNRPQNAELLTEQPSRFQPRRIDPSDVPPGMRVVSTPFGDRLVEE